MFSCQFCEISKNTFFTEHLLATASKAVSLDVNDVCFEEEQVSLIRMKNQENVKAFSNGVDVGNEV